MPEIQITVSPVNSEKYVEREYLSPAHFDAITNDARIAFQAWKKTSIKERVECVLKFVDVFQSMKEEAAKEIVWQMGRPVKYAAGEVNGLAERARCMASLAKESLSDHELKSTDKPGFRRFIRREPLGVVLILPAWNFPLLTAVNGVVPALLAGNSVILKHSFQTPLSAERFAEAFKQAGLPEKVLQVVHVSYHDTDELVKHPLVDYVNFTGSVQTGRTIQKAAAMDKFIGCGLELGGKDPAYVRADCNLDYTVDQLVDGAYFNSGQSCCGIERIYVHSSLYDSFVEKFVNLVKKFKLGDPTDPETTLGPLIRTSAANDVRRHVAEAVAQGAKPLIDPKLFPKDQEGTPYLAPQVLVNVNHTMTVMTEETFGPVVGIMKVDNDEEAIRLMNDSKYGLTASIWTKDEDAAIRIGDQVETGTVFLNRCDYLDPELAWVGVKNSGRGCTLSKYGFDNLTRPKSFHLKISTA